MTRVGVPALALAAVVVSGCMMIGPDYQRPSAPLAHEWIARDANDIVRPAEPIGPWWESFDDPILSNLIAEAYRQNPSLQAAGVRVLEAQAPARDRHRHSLSPDAERRRRIPPYGREREHDRRAPGT
jgi:outer membrane protein TolC